MSYKLSWEGEILTILLDKKIDESANFDGIDWKKAKVIVVDFKNVSEFSSNIVASWVKFVSSIHVNMIYRNCPNLIVDFVCTISDFITFETRVESFEMISYCDSCEADHSQIVQLSDLKERDGSIKDMRGRCKTKCGGITIPMESFDSRVKVLFQIGQ
jgi:hypothetical protein